MPVVSLTRLRLRSLRYYPIFMWHCMASARQMQRATGFLDGLLASEGALSFWTFSVWKDEAAMLAFRDANAHRKAMPMLVNWCDEACVARYEKVTPHLPTCDDALTRMTSSGRLSKVRNPSEAQISGRLFDTLRTPKPGLRLQPKPGG